MDHERREQYNLFRSFFEEPFLASVPHVHVSRIDLTNQQIDFLVSVGLFEPCDESELSFGLGVHIFLVEETMKKRFRLIVHTRDINDFVEVVPSVSFIDIQHTIAEGLKGLPTYTADIKAYYHQIKIDDCCRKYYSFRTPRGVFHLTTVATGQRQCVGRAQLLALTILQHSTTSALESSEAYVDNFRAIHFSELIVTQFQKQFCALCKSLRVTLNPDEVTTAGEYEYRGVLFRQRENVPPSVHVAEKTRGKLTIALKALESYESWTMHDALSVFGLCVYASCILQLPTAQYYYVYKFIRRKGTLDLKEPAKIWPSIVDPWKTWIHQLLSHPGRTAMTHHDENDVYTVVTDASTTGYGGYVFFRGEILTVAGKWFPPFIGAHINELEAVSLKITLVRTVPRYAPVNIFIDNTTVKFCLAKRRSKSFRINGIVGFIAANWTILHCSYISSKSNIADHLSRGQPVPTGTGQLAVGDILAKLAKDHGESVPVQQKQCCTSESR